MKYIGIITSAYIVLFALDMLQRRTHKRTQSLQKFTIRTISDVGMLGIIGGGLWIGILIFGFVTKSDAINSPLVKALSIIWLGLMFFAMIAPLKGVWDICVDGDDITVIKAFIWKQHWKISDISYCLTKRGGLNVYVNGRTRKAFFVDAMTDHFDNFVNRMEEEGKTITSEQKSKT